MTAAAANMGAASGGVMRVLIINTVVLNGGDAAILEAVIAQVEQAFPARAIELVVFDSQAEIAADYYEEFSFAPQLYEALKVGYHPLNYLLPGPQRPLRVFWVEALRRLGLSLESLLLDPRERELLELWRGADLIVSTGGTYLRENYGLRGRFFSFQLAQMLGKPLVLYTQSLGPFADPQNRQKIRELLDRAALVLLRDKASHEHLLELGVRAQHLEVLPDVVFAMADESVLESRRWEPLPMQEQRVAISLRDWPYFKTMSAEEGMRRYREAIGELVVELVEEYGATVCFLSTCQGIEEYRFDDAEVAREVVASLPDEIAACVEVDGDFHRPEQLRKKLASFDLVIATRMHMAIEALIVGTPVLPISYEFKTRELFEELGFGELVVDIEEIDVQRLLESLQRLQQRLGAGRGELVEGVCAMAQRARAGQMMLTRVVG